VVASEAFHTGTESFISTDQLNHVSYIRQVNGVKLADILFSLLSMCVSVCEHPLYLDANISKTV